jgi:anti-anti-sigma factor
MLGVLAVTTLADFPVVTVRIRGVLDFEAAPEVRKALRKQLADQPAVLVLDLADVVLARPAALSVLRSAIRAATDGPAGVPIVIIAPDPRIHDALRRSGFDRQVYVAGSAAEAAELAARHPAPLRHVLRGLLPQPGTLREARQAVGAACGSWGVSGVSLEAELVAGELVTNAIEHARTVFDVTIAYRVPYIHLAIRDGCPRPPRQTGPDTSVSARGRGLLVVDNIAAAWGSVPSGSGKVVWATIRATGQDREPPAAHEAVVIRPDRWA